jgi:hypothetical protein
MRGRPVCWFHLSLPSLMSSSALPHYIPIFGTKSQA